MNRRFLHNDLSSYICYKCIILNNCNHDQSYLLTFTVCGTEHEIIKQTLENIFMLTYYYGYSSLESRDSSMEASLFPNLISSEDRCDIMDTLCKLGGKQSYMK